MGHTLYQGRKHWRGKGQLPPNFWQTSYLILFHRIGGWGGGHIKPKKILITPLVFRPSYGPVYLSQEIISRVSWLLYTNMSSPSFSKVCTLNQNWKSYSQIAYLFSSMVKLPVKFRFSEKATKICTIFLTVLKFT